MVCYLVNYGTLFPSPFTSIVCCVPSLALLNKKWIDNDVVCISGPEKFASVFLGEFDTPEVVWGAEMR